MGQTWGTLRTLAQDREKWRDFVAALVAHGKKGSEITTTAAAAHVLLCKFVDKADPRLAHGITKQKVKERVKTVKETGKWEGGGCYSVLAVAREARVMS
ncbi:hypothetical protein ElyMa_003101100 [Elysia marginata]|uniref:Uncharacterized protein n=1 Tax=Elysia marginata TaxID=1093978 RepID=A0AAV4IPE6_9GAST|nr:hypothetical protein ElyMa_003101100 [Elysia marginata]